MAPSTKSKPSARTASSTLKQEKLGFPTMKRTSTGSQIKGKKFARTKSTPVPPRAIDVSISNPVSENESIENASTLSPESLVSDIESAHEDNLETLMDSPKMKNHWGSVRRTMGWIQPIHSEDQTNVNHILRVFDLSYDYGPCIGVTRLERWNRASAMGLNPPIEVRDILLTQRGKEEPELSQCVFEAEV